MDTFNEAYLNTLNDQTPKKDRLEILIDTYKNKQNLSKEDIIELLHIAIIDEWLAEFNYFASYNLSKTDGKSDFDPEFEQHENEEREHRKMLVNRLRELNTPVPIKLLSDFQKLNSNGNKWTQELNSDSNKILLNRYNEELNAIKYYDLILYVIQKLKETGDFDSTTQQIIKKIKADEETHAKDLRDLLVEHGVLNDASSEGE
jgi:bacterioferritin